MTTALHEITELIKTQQIEDQESLNNVKQPNISFYLYFLISAFTPSGENKC